MTPYSFNPMGHDDIVVIPSGTIVPYAKWVDGGAVVEEGVLIENGTASYGGYLEAGATVIGGEPPVGAQGGKLIHCAATINGTVYFREFAYGDGVSADMGGLIIVEGPYAQVDGFSLISGGTLSIMGPNCLVSGGTIDVANGAGSCYFYGTATSVTIHTTHGDYPEAPFTWNGEIDDNYPNPPQQQEDEEE